MGMRTAKAWLIVASCWLGCIATHYNTTCQFHMADKEIYDLSNLRTTSVKDYTYRQGDRLYVVNFCSPAIRVCNGITGAFVSVWNYTSFECIDALAENDPETAYLELNNPKKGILITYKGRQTTSIAIECDQAYEQGILAGAEMTSTNPDSYRLLIKTKLACRNYAEPETPGWGWFAKLLFIVLISLVLYCVIGIFLNVRRSSYTSFSESLPHHEFWLSLLARAKEFIRNLYQPSPIAPSNLPSS